MAADIFFAIVGAQYDPGTRAAALAWILTIFALSIFALQRGITRAAKLYDRQWQGRFNMPLPDGLRHTLNADNIPGWPLP